MATAAYHRWVAKGRPWRLATPIQNIRDWAGRNGVRVLGTIGNTAHLTSSTPQDHTPFSASAWPIPLKGYVVCAIDLGDKAGLSGRILAAARAGAYPWLKYANLNGWHYEHDDGFREGYRSADDHIHLSIRSDWIDRTITFDPQGDIVANEKTLTEISNAVWNKDGVIKAPSTWGNKENTHLAGATYLADIRDQLVRHRAESKAQHEALLGVLAKVLDAAGAKVTQAQLTKAAEEGARSALADVEFGWNTPDEETLAAAAGEQEEPKARRAPEWTDPEPAAEETATDTEGGEQEKTPTP